MKTAEILTIGDEILYGQITDTNAPWMAAALSDIGIKVIRKTTVGDIREDILQAFEEAEKRADVVLITGGLGPTNDDLTKPCLASYFNCEIKIHAEALAEVTAYFESRGRALTELNRQQAALPICCEKITNVMGTAPGMWFTRNNKVFVSMPGVPHEMKRMMTDIIIPKLKSTYALPSIQHHIIRTIGIGESFLAEKIEPWEKSLPPHIKLAYLPSLGEVKLRLSGSSLSQEKLYEEINHYTNALNQYASEYIYGYGTDPIEMVIGKQLASQHLTIATAESCTGGYLGHLFTSIPGSSTYYVGGVIAYSNTIKMEQFGVSNETLENYGAVSEETIIQMAEGVRKRFNTAIGVATSGVAGPTGGSPEKPVGTVWIAYADKDKTVTKKLQLSKDRLINIKLSTVHVFNLIRTNLPKP
jgi:nicotinamide-nucleotide amidase